MYLIFQEGLKIWLDTDVTVSDPDAQRGLGLPGLVKALVQPSFRWLQCMISSATLQKDIVMGWQSLIKSSQVCVYPPPRLLITSVSMWHDMDPI